MGICSRQGLGGQRHIATHSLWVQQALRENRFTLHKISGEVNPADVFTKHMASRERLSQLMRLFGCKFTSGRATSAPAIRSGMGTKMTMTAHADLQACTDAAVVPHLQGDAFVNNHYPPLVPLDTGAGDEDMWRSDGLLERGYAIAREVMERAAMEGRVKRHGS